MRTRDVEARTHTHNTYHATWHRRRSDGCPSYWSSIWSLCRPHNRRGASTTPQIYAPGTPCTPPRRDSSGRCRREGQIPSSWFLEVLCSCSVVVEGKSIFFISGACPIGYSHKQTVKNRGRGRGRPAWTTGRPKYRLQRSPSWLLGLTLQDISSLLEDPSSARLLGELGTG